MSKIEVGDCREILTRWADEGVQVQTCVTSPPYLGLRDYGIADQLGMEPTMAEYVSNLVDVFRCVWRVLRDDGTLWIVLGDSYTGSGKEKVGKSGYKDGRKNRLERLTVGGVSGFKPKNLMGVPWRVAIALQADGWVLRNDIIWHKPNPMPTSVTDRCTNSHEHVFLFAKKSPYYFDNEAIKEPSAGLGATAIRFGGSKYGDSDDPKHITKSGNAYTDNGTRNKRDVWTVATKPTKECHFATFPPKLIEPCILAGSRPGDTVLDPFMGAGTTATVAIKHGREYLGCELNPEYKKISDRRIAQAHADAPTLFQEVE